MNILHPWNLSIPQEVLYSEKIKFFKVFFTLRKSVILKTVHWNVLWGNKNSLSGIAATNPF